MCVSVSGIRTCPDPLHPQPCQFRRTLFLTVSCVHFGTARAAQNSKSVSPEWLTHFTTRSRPRQTNVPGLCAEFPSLSWLDATPEKALQGIRRVVAQVIKDMRANGESVPEPISRHRYSGKFVVRVPPEVHRKLAMEAAEEDISLNRLVSAKLSS